MKNPGLARNVADRVCREPIESWPTAAAPAANVALGAALRWIADQTSGTAGLTTFPAGAAAANDVSLAEVIRYIQENIIVGAGTALPADSSLYGVLAGATGIPTWPSAAAPGNAVSIAEALRDLWDAVRNGTGGTEPGTNKSVIDAIGMTGAARSDAAGGLLYEMLAIPRCVEKTDGAVLSGDDDLFTISGGPVIATIYGIVTTVIGAGTTNVKYTHTTTSPAGTVDLNAGAVDIDGDAAGTSYRNINTTSVFTPVTAGTVLLGNAFATNDHSFFLPPGTVKLNSSAARSGVIAHYMEYRPLSHLSRVVAAP